MLIELKADRTGEAYKVNQRGCRGLEKWGVFFNFSNKNDPENNFVEELRNLNLSPAFLKFTWNQFIFH